MILGISVPIGIMTLWPWTMSDILLIIYNYPLVNVYITMENHHFFMGKSTISMAIFNSYLYVYQAGYVPWSFFFWNGLHPIFGDSHPSEIAISTILYYWNPWWTPVIKGKWPIKLRLNQEWSFGCQVYIYIIIYIYIWLVVSNMNFIVHHIWDNPSHWLSYFSGWLLHHQPDIYTVYIHYVWIPIDPMKLC